MIATFPGTPLIMHGRASIQPADHAKEHAQIIQICLAATRVTTPT
jgi:hypothetical protein